MILKLIELYTHFTTSTHAVCLETEISLNHIKLLPNWVKAGLNNIKNAYLCVWVLPPFPFNVTLWNLDVNMWDLFHDNLIPTQKTQSIPINSESNSRFLSSLLDLCTVRNLPTLRELLHLPYSIISRSLGLGQGLLVDPCSRCQTKVYCAFEVVAPKLWECLPDLRTPLKSSSKPTC